MVRMYKLPFYAGSDIPEKEIGRNMMLLYLLSL